MKKKQSDVTLERLNKSIKKETRPCEVVENMILKDIKNVIDSYLVYHNEDFSCLFLENQSHSELKVTVKYQRIKDIKVL